MILLSHVVSGMSFYFTSSLFFCACGLHSSTHSNAIRGCVLLFEARQYGIRDFFHGSFLKLPQAGS